MTNTIEQQSLSTSQSNQVNKPEAKFVAGPVSAVVWKNGEEQQFSTVSLSRSYKDKSGNWQNSNTLRVNDLPKASMVLQKAYEFLTTKAEA